MRLLKFVLGILLLRRLPGGTMLSWLIRLGIWSWLISLMIKKVKPFFAETPANQAMREPSGWTATAAESAAPVEMFESTHLTTTITSSSADIAAETSEQVETVTETVSEVTEIWGMPADDTGAVETAPSAVAPEEPVVVEEPEPAPQFAPRWVKGDGTLECPPEFPVKAKATSMIFHEPGSQHYNVTVADVCYYSPEDAAQAGYRPPKR
jgi:hypothetical protein